MRYLPLLLLSSGCILLTQSFQTICGDGFVQSGEDCDDGGVINGDGCDADCQDEVAVCGDGIPDTDEECDEGQSNSDTGGCTLSCTIAICGDNLIQTDIETCDDGNLDAGDGCNAQCQIEDGCGDNNIDVGEECDDGPANSAAGACTPNCTDAVCGDTFVQAGIEQCDDGNQENNDDCTNTCLLPVCGDGLLLSGEACDDGNTNNGDGCNTQCQVEACNNGISVQGERCFVRQDTSTQGSSSRVAVADIDLDQDDDIILCSTTHIESFLGASGALPGAGFSLPVGDLGGCTGLAIGRFENSEFGVAAAYSEAPNGTLMLVSRNSGNVSARILTLTNELPLEILSLDLGNGNGREELLVAMKSINTVRLFSNLANAQPTTNDLNSPAQPFGLALGNFSNDDLLDLVAVSSASNTHNFFVQTSGDFVVDTSLDIGASCFFAQSADVTGSLRDDIVFSCPGSDQIIIREQNPVGVFTQSASLTFSALVNPTALAITDLDNDGDNDIALTDQSAIGQIILLFNEGGVFSLANSLTFPAGNSPSSIAVGDFNGDDLPDLVAANAGSTFFTMLLSNP